MWSYCPGHAGVKGHGPIDRLRGKATITSGLRFGRSKKLRSLRFYLRAQKQGHHTIETLEERDVYVERQTDSGRPPTLKGRERAIGNQTDIEIVSTATLGKLLREGVELL